jgi:hypothetical protein
MMIVIHVQLSYPAEIRLYFSEGFLGVKAVSGVLNFNIADYSAQPF